MEINEKSNVHRKDLTQIASCKNFLKENSNFKSNQEIITQFSSCDIEICNAQVA